MPEATADATLMIATSWQALSRAETGDEKTMICNCTVAIVFSGFYIEANLNHIIAEMKGTDALRKFSRNPGLQEKLAWFYTTHISKATGASKKDIYLKLREEFPGFSEIHEFRNKVSHGVIDRDLANIKTTRRLRKNAKQIVDKLFDYASKENPKISRGTTYEFAISTKDLT